MSDDTVFARFIHEMRTLLTAIEAHCDTLSDAAPSERRPHALREIARLAHAASALAEAFAVDDLRALAEALAEVTSIAADQVKQSGEAEPLAPLGVRDTLSYLQWRVERLAAVGQAEPPTARDLALIGRLNQALATALEVNPLANTFTDASELTLAEVALVQSFSSAPLRKRDPQADARLLARMAETPAFVAQTASGAGVPVFGGMTEEEFDTVPPEMKRIFVNEAPADLRELSQLVLAFERQPEELRILEKMAFLAHKIKGGAATMGFVGFSDIAVLLEEVVTNAPGTPLSASPAFLPGLGRFLDLLEQGLAAAAQLEEPAPALLDDARRLRDALLHPHAMHTGQPTPAMADADRSGGRERPADQELVLRIEAGKLDMLMNQLSALAANRGAVNRNRSEIAHAQAEMQAALARLREKSAQIADGHPLTYDNLIAVAQSAGPSHQLAAEGMTGAMMAAAAPVAPQSSSGALRAQTSSGALRASWSSLQLEQYTEVDTALRALAEVVADVTANYGALNALLNRLGQITEAQEALTRGLQEDAMSIRLARLSEIAPRLRISALVAAADLGKQLDFEAQGASIEIDRLLLEELEQPLIQLVRNAVAHGIEGADERVAQGKPAKGRVWIHAYNVGSEVVIEVGDDGRGIDAHLLVGAAIGAQLITPEAARRLSQEQALSFMFQSGFTTATTVGAMAGSGVGLADVASTIHRLKGSIAMRSDLGKGSAFQIRVPISLSMAPVLEVSAAGQVFALPFALVEYTAIIEPADLRERAPAQAFAASGGLREWRAPVDASLLPAADGAPTAGDAAGAAEAATAPEADMPAYALAETLGFEQDVAALRRIVVIRLRGQLVGLLVESVGDGDVRDATVRPLPRRLQRRVVRGAIVRPEDGQVALLIDPQEALAQRLAGAEIALRPAGQPSGPRAVAPWALIVDDSVTIRRTLEQTLTQAGFKTSQARDGYEALEIMARELPRVVILDVEMPRLSGYQLLTIMRSSPQYQQVRVAMLTSRAADKHRDYALALGADAYLVKPCPQETLVETIRRLLTESEPE